ncbi:hypothetical protein BS78_02G044600 [Paspalum vaginatum]|nr:hypothetical protein BS78_02G044600 [Paspalum vaginatum]
MPATTMVAIDKGVAAPSAAAAHDSNSDNESPTNKEPEFVVDVMDDLQPLPPQRQLSLHQQMVHGMAAVLQRQEHLLQLGGPSLSWPEQHQEPERESDLFIITIFCCVAAVFLAGLTVTVALRLPSECTTKGEGSHRVPSCLVASPSHG